jgi:prephenate dehydrogenase
MKITVIGSGSIGTLLTRQLHSKGYCSEVISICTNKDTLKKDLELLVGNKSKNEKEKPIDTCLLSDIILLDLPLTLSIKFLPAILSVVDEYTVVMDIAAAKEQTSKCVKRHKKRRQFVPTHPIIEYTFSENTDKNLFENKTCVICANDSALFAVERITELYDSLNMNIVFLKEEDHDKFIAYSHLFQLVSFTMSSLLLENKKNIPGILSVSSPGLIASLRSERYSPDIWSTVFEYNSASISKITGKHIMQLTKMKKEIEKKRSGKIIETIKKINEIKNNIK